MMNRNRSHWLETISLALCAAVLTLGLPGAADAKEPGDRHGYLTVEDDDHANHRGRSHAERRSDARDGWFNRHTLPTPYWMARHARRDGHHYRHHASRHHTPHYAHGVKYTKHYAKFQCRACNHTFRDQRHFYDHVHQRHHVPFWRIPFLLVHASTGWIFYG